MLLASSELRIFLLVLMAHPSLQIRSVTLREACGLKVLQKRFLREIFGSKRTS
jgi:hypothetical protein